MLLVCVCVLDFYSTFVAMAGANALSAGPDDADTAPTPLDSIDQTAYIMGTSSVSARTLMIHDHYLNGAQHEHEHEQEQEQAVAPVEVSAGSAAAEVLPARHFSSLFCTKPRVIS